MTKVTDKKRSKGEVAKKRLQQYSWNKLTGDQALIIYQHLVQTLNGNDIDCPHCNKSFRKPLIDVHYNGNGVNMHPVLIV